MKIIELDKETYIKYSNKNPLISFSQMYGWGKVKENTGWKELLLGYEDDNKEILALGSFLLKKLPIFNSYLCYSNRGYLIDYTNSELLASFHKDLVSYLKSKHVFTLIIDPYLPLKERDIDGDVVESGFDNTSVVEELIKLGYKHNGYNLYYENLQPRWLFRLNISKPYEELEKGFKNEAKRRSRKKNIYAIETRELKKEELHIFIDLMEKTADRRGFEDRPLSYYENMYDALHEGNVVRFMVSEMDTRKCKENILKEIEINKNNIAKYKSPGRVKEEEVTLQANEKLLAQVEECISSYGDKAPLSASCIMSSYKEMIFLLAGNDERFLQTFNSSNIMVTDLIKLAQSEQKEYFNFYGITGDFSKENPLYGLYSYKRQYGGEVVELIGQFEYTINKLFKTIYNIASKIRG